MKKSLLIPFTVFFAFILTSGTVLAAVVNHLSSDTDNSYEYLDTVEMLPVDVIYNPDKREIRKIYELDPGDSPDRLPRESFERDGYAYEYCDILREAVNSEVQKTMALTIYTESEKDDLNSVLALLPQYRQEEDEYGYSGILTLNPASIKSEVYGYSVSSSPYSITLTYPDLYYKDTHSIPNTVYDDSCMLTLQYIHWWSGATAINNNMDAPIRYSAYAFYSGTKTSSYIKSYEIAAEYTGEVYKNIIDKIRYTMVFSGSPQTEPALVSEQGNDKNIIDAEKLLSEEYNQMSGKFYISTILSILALMAGGGSLFLTLRSQARMMH